MPWTDFDRAAPQEPPLTNKRRAAIYLLLADYHDYAEGRRALGALTDEALDTLLVVYGYRWTGGAWVRDEAEEARREVD